MEYNIAANQVEAFPEMGLMSIEDVMGHVVVVKVLLALREAGQYQMDHKQYDNICKQQSVFSNLWHASARGAALNILIGRDTRGQSMLLTSCPMDSEWWKRFDKGLIVELGQNVRSQSGFSIGVRTVMIRRLELLWNDSWYQALPNKIHALVAEQWRSR